jgi:hypothetical protein
MIVESQDRSIYISFSIILIIIGMLIILFTPSHEIFINLVLIKYSGLIFVIIGFTILFINVIKT